MAIIGRPFPARNLVTMRIHNGEIVEGKECTACGEWFPLDQYHYNGKGDKRRAYCCRCTSTKRRARTRGLDEHDREVIRASQRRFWYKRTYKIHAVDVALMKIAQGGKCAIRGCDNEATCIDHDHTTGKVRAILCNGCNSALGYTGEDPRKLRGLLRYLKEHSGPIGSTGG